MKAEGNMSETLNPTKIMIEPKCDSKKWTTFTICLVDKIIGFYKARSLLCLGLERLCLLCVFFFKDVELYSYHRIDEAAPESKEEI